MEIVQWLFDTHSYVSRNNCGIGWTNGKIVIYQLANFIIFLSYISLPVTLYVLYSKVKKIRMLAEFNPWSIIMFIIFIIACGTGHLEGVLSFFWPPYNLFMIWHCITAIASAITAIIFPAVCLEIIRRLPND